MANNIKNIDYKDVETLKKFINPHGRITPKRTNKLNSKTQRRVALAIKRARFMGLLPFTQK